MNISMNFAIDRNRDRKIQPEEIVPLASLKERDSDQDGQLQGRELRDVYFQYGQDCWLEGGRRHRLQSGETTQFVELRSLSLDPPKLDLHIDMTF
ncbi:hypothetical protein JST97_20370 [bacterium]|nr:hypothetical protein [bacterium]